MANRGRIAFLTLGCKVNEYDTEAMRELFEGAGWTSVPFSQEADVYLINTCTVTATGDGKSVKAIRRAAREHPNADIIVAGCLAQKDAGRVALPGVRLVIGSARRGEVVSLYESAAGREECLVAVGSLRGAAFERLRVGRHENRTRAVMKIQEGCDRYCAYCVIPYVRGPVRSMPIDQVREEALALSRAGYREIVLTGIHLASYGRDAGETLANAVRAACEPESVARVRLGSLEPCVVTDEFLQSARSLKKLCPHFHLSLQSGSAGVLSRMRRRYTPEEYALAAERLRRAFPGCALTTDVLTGFPGETEEEALETERFVMRMAFARIHVFPYSPREGTLAARMPDQVPETVKRARAARLIAIGNKLEEAFVTNLVGSEEDVLFETASGDGFAEGYTASYARVRAKARPGALLRVRITATEGKLALAETTEMHCETAKEGIPMNDCLFCRIIAGEIPSQKVYEDEWVYAFRDINPQAPVHILIVPKEHMPSALSLSGEKADVAAKAFRAAAVIAKSEGIDESGFRIVTNCGRDGAQSVAHLHFHLLGGARLSERMS